ncbi:MAG: CvpA family protein [Bacteroidota bacterium]
MNYLDLALCVPLLWAAYKGFTKGLIIEVASLVALALGIYGGIEFSGFAADWLTAQWELDGDVLPIAAFALTFLVIVIAVYALAKVLEKVVNLVALKLVNKITGAVFGMVKMALIVSVLLVLLQVVERQFSLIPPDLKEGSLLYGPLAGFVPTIIPALENQEWYSLPAVPV